MTVDSKGNSGNSNSGHSNSGYWNSGHSNSGYWNSGNSNSGYWNSGDSNSGRWNSGHWNSGYFNECTPESILVFDKVCSRKEWADADKPSFLYFKLTEVVNGELISYEYKEAFKRSYDETTDEDKAKVLNLPNFCPDKFFRISGIDVRETGKDKELAQKKQALIEKANELLKQAEEL